MSRDFELIRVEPNDIELGKPLPYSIFTEDGSLLAALGSEVLDAQQAMMLMQKGRRRIEHIGPVSDDNDEDAGPTIPGIAVEHLASIRPAPLARTTVLVADDMHMARTMLSQILVSAGVARVITVEDGRRAIKSFIDVAPNLVLLDIDMPKLDGLSALKRIRCWSPGVFACLVSANSSLVNVQMAREYSVNGFVAKPYSALNIQRILKRYLARVPRSPAG